MALPGIHGKLFRRKGVAPAADLSAMTKKELVAEASRRGIALKPSMTKAAMIEALKG